MGGIVIEELKVLDLFSGIGAFKKALDNCNIKHTIIGYCEIDKWASKAYSVLYDIPESFNLGDIKKVNIDELDDFSVMFYGYPCQDVSIGGKTKGIRIKCKNCNTEHALSDLIGVCCPNCGSEEVESTTRTALLLEALKIAKHKKPKFMIAENVDNLVGKGFIKDFEKTLDILESIGYKNYWAVLNSKNFNLPQSRLRVFIVSIRNDTNKEFIFPKGKPTELRLKDMLEKEVPEKYYMSYDRCEKLFDKIKSNISQSKNGIIQVNEPSFSQQRVYSPYGNAPTIAAGNLGGGKEPCKIIVEKDGSGIVKLFDIPRSIVNDNERQRRVYSVDGISPTVLARSDSPKIVSVGMLDMKASQQVRKVYSPDGVSPTLDTMQGGHRQPKILVEEMSKEDMLKQYRVRKLMPVECWKLMGFTSSDFYKVKEGLNNHFHKGKDKSDSQLYKMAGNSICVSVLEAIMLELFSEYVTS